MNYKFKLQESGFKNSVSEKTIEVERYLFFAKNVVTPFYGVCACRKKNTVNQ